MPMVWFVTAATGVAFTIKPIIVSVTAPTPKQSVCEPLRICVRVSFFFASSSPASGAMSAVTTTVDK